MNPSQIPGPLVASMLASMAAIGLWRAPITTFVTLGSGAAGYWLGIQKIVSVKSPRTWLANDLPPDRLAADFDLLQLRQEIRETTTTIAGLRQEFATTKTQYRGELSNLSSRLSPLESSTSKASSQLQTLQSSFQELNQRLSQELKQFNDQLIPTGRSLTRLETELVAIHQKLTAATLELSTRNDGLNCRIKPIETEIRRLSSVTTPLDMSTRIAALEAQLPTLVSKPELQALDTHGRTENLQRHVDTLQQTLIQHGKNAATREGELIQVRQDLCELSRQLKQALQQMATQQQTPQESLRQQLAQFSEAQINYNDRLNLLESLTADVQALRERIDHLSSRLEVTASAAPDLTPLETAIAYLQQQHLDLTAQVDQQLRAVGLTVQDLSTTQQNHAQRLEQLEPLTPELRALQSQVVSLRESTSVISPVNLEPLETTLTQLQQQLVDLGVRFDHEQASLNSSIQTLGKACERLNIDLHSLSNQLSNLSTSSSGDLVPLQAAVQQLAHEFAELHLENQSIAAQISKPIADSGIDMKVIYGRTEALQQKMDFLKKRFQEIENIPQPLLLWRDRPAPKERIAQRPDIHRVAVFVDGSNIVKSAEENRFPLNTTEYASNLLNFLENIQGSHSVYFHGFEINSEVSQTLNDIEALGYRVVKRKGKAGRYVKANMDSYIILEMLQYADVYDTAVLVSGDGDFIPIVHWLRSQNKRVEVLGIHKTVAFGLQDAADFYEAIRVGKHLVGKPI